LNIKSDSPTERYLFDGKTTSVLVPSTTVDKVIPERFSLSFSMKHARGSKEEQKQKENILCESDDFSKQCFKDYGINLGV
jgi:hypothetical protein